MGKKWEVQFFQNQKGEMPVKIWIDALPKNSRSKVYSFLEMLTEKGPELPRPYADLLKDGIHELRIKLSGKQSRILYFFCFETEIVLTNEFIKKTKKVPEKEINLAKNCRDYYIQQEGKDE